MMYLSYLAGYILFFLIAAISFFIPGTLFLSLVKLKWQISKTEKFALTWFIGIALFLLATYLTAYAQMPNLYEFAIAMFTSIWLFQHMKIKNDFHVSIAIADKWSIFIIFLGSLAFTSIMFFSGFSTKAGLQFMGTNGVDGIRHIAYITDQITHFPPMEPSIAGMPLHGFHYFYDFLLSRFSLFYHVPVEDLYFRYFPLLVSLLYGLAFVMVTNRITQSKTTKRFILFLAYFSQSSTIFLYIFSQKIDLIGNAIVQPLTLIINPFIVLSIGMLLCGLSILPFLKISWKYGLLFGLIIGVISEVKVYSGIIAIACLIFYSTYLIVRYKKRYLMASLITLSITGLITAITFLPNNLGAGSLIFAPLLFFQHYMQTELFTPLHWEERRVIYTQKNNYLDLAILYGISITIFAVINLGIRLITILKVRKLFHKSFWKSDTNTILFFAHIVSISIGSFFIQSVSVFDTVQFFWIYIAMFSIPTGVVLGQMYEKGKQKYILLFVIAVMTIPGIIATEYQYLFSPVRTIISSEDISVLEQIPAIVPSNTFITLLPPTQELLTNNYLLPKGTPYIAAVAQRELYYESGWLPSPDAIKYLTRRKEIQILKNAANQCLPGKINEIVKQIGSPYILTIGRYPCLEASLSVIKKINEPKSQLFFYYVRIQ